MKLQLAAILIAGLMIHQAHAEKKEKNTALKDQKDKVSYIIGFSLGTDFKNKSMDVKPDLVAAGIKDALAGGKSALTKEEISETMTSFQNEMRAKMAAQQGVTAPDSALGEKNRKEGGAFLAENKKKKGVKTLPSGLQYKVIKAGTGPTPKASDMVTTNYRGTLIDGTEFDSSYGVGAREFPVTGVISGWTEALQLMKVGSKWQLFIPPNLAYGEQGSGPIGPSAALIFEIELISIK